MAGIEKVDKNTDLNITQTHEKEVYKKANDLFKSINYMWDMWRNFYIKESWIKVEIRAYKDSDNWIKITIFKKPSTLDSNSHIIDETINISSDWVLTIEETFLQEWRTLNYEESKEKLSEIEFDVLYDDKRIENFDRLSLIIEETKDKYAYTDEWLFRKLWNYV